MTTTALPTAELFGQFSGKALETLSLWADANQSVLRQLVEFSDATVSEGVRAFTELQTSTLTVLKSGQHLLLTQQGRLPTLPTDPIATFQKSVLDGVEGAQQAFKLVEAGAASAIKTAERLQASAEKTSRDILGTLTTLAGELKPLYAPDVK